MEIPLDADHRLNTLVHPKLSACDERGNSKCVNLTDSECVNPHGTRELT